MTTKQEPAAQPGTGGTRFSAPSGMLQPRPAIKCLPLPAFDSADLNLVRRMFQSVPRQPMGQSWLETEEPDFAPANVRTAWRGSSWLVFAELTDADIFNSAVGLDQRVWELGDTLEIFVRPADQPEYFEFQVTPANHTLQLRFADAVALENLRRNDAMAPVLMRRSALRSRTWVNDSRKCWYVYAEIGAAALGEPPGLLQGRQWWFSFSRYDYTRGRAEPVISSTSPHAEPDFHRYHEWARVNFENHSSSSPQD